MTTNYTTFQSQFFNAVAAYSSDVQWGIEFPLVIDRAEQRIYRDLDLLGTRVNDTSGTLTANSRLFTLPTTRGSFLVVEQVTAITPAGAFSSNGGSKNVLVRCSPVFIDLVWPSETASTGLPEFFAMVNATTIKVGSAPDQAYNMEIYGTQRPTPLSSGNSSTILTQMLPDLWFAAAMVEAGTYMRYTEPQIGASWLAEYNTLKQSALVEESRKKFYAEGWVDKLPSPIATPPRQ